MLLIRSRDAVQGSYEVGCKLFQSRSAAGARSRAVEGSSSEVA